LQKLEIVKLTVSDLKNLDVTKYSTRWISDGFIVLFDRNG